MDKELQLELFWLDFLASNKKKKLEIRKHLRIYEKYILEFLVEFYKYNLYLNLRRTFFQYIYITRLLKKKVLYVEIKQLPFKKTLSMVFVPMAQWNKNIVRNVQA